MQSSQKERDEEKLKLKIEERDEIVKSHKLEYNFLD
jgi:hypothetical protein